MGNCANNSNDVIKVNSIDMYQTIEIDSLKKEKEPIRNRIAFKKKSSANVDKSNFSSSTICSEKPSSLVLSHIHSKIETIEEIIELNEKEKKLNISNLSTEEKIRKRKRV